MALYNTSFSNCGWLFIDASGILYAMDPGFVAGATSSPIARDTWHLIEFGWRINSTGQGTLSLRLNGVSIGSSSTMNLGNIAHGQMRLGRTIASGAGVDMYWDDFAVNDDQGTDQNNYPGDGGIILLRPTADSARGANWLGGAGGTTNLYDAVNNAPPVGVASTGTKTSQVRNSANDSTGNYDATMQSYTAAGVPAGATVKVAQAVLNVGTNNATATAGAVRIVSNPAEGAETSFANFGTAVAGTYPRTG